MKIECIRFKSYVKDNLQGFADIYVEDWDAEVHGCTLHMKNGKRWLNVPGFEYDAKDGTKRFNAFLRFRKKKRWELFIEQAKKAIDKWCAENPKAEI